MPTTRPEHQLSRQPLPDARRPLSRSEAGLTLLALAVAAVYPLKAHALSAGVAQFIGGEVSVKRPDGKTDSLAKGGALESGHSILTGINGRAQVKFSDGGLVSLQPNTEFKLSNYVDQADARQDRFVVDLLRGSMRAITGLIGKRNRENYKVTTTTATIGIRGSAFSAGYNPDGSLTVTTELDAIEVCNAAGCIGLTAGESVTIKSSDAAPVRTNARAPMPTPEPAQNALVTGNQVDSSGRSSFISMHGDAKQVFTDLSVGILYNSGSEYLETFTPDSGNSTLLSVLQSGKLAEFTYTSPPGPGGDTTKFKAAPGGISASGMLGVATDIDFVGWGSWVSGERVYNGMSSAIDSVHYVMGRPTLNMPGANYEGTYAFAGGTAVSSTLGAGTITGGSLVAYFGSGGYADLNLTTQFQAITQNLSTSLNINGASLSQSTCGSNVTGFFTGNGATRAGLVYSLPSMLAGQVSGAAAFQRTSLVYNMSY